MPEANQQTQKQTETNSYISRWLDYDFTVDVTANVATLLCCLMDSSLSSRTPRYWATAEHLDRDNYNEVFVDMGGVMAPRTVRQTCDQEATDGLITGVGTAARNNSG